MTPIRRIFKDYADSGSLSGMVGIFSAVDDHTFFTKAGHFLQFLRLEGPDAQCRDASELDDIARRFESALRAFGEDCRVHQYLVRREGATIPTGSYDNPIVREAVETRAAFLASKSRLWSVETTIVIEYEGWHYDTSLGAKISRLLRSPLGSLREALWAPEKSNALLRQMDDARQTLAAKVASFMVQLPEGLTAKQMDQQAAFRFLRGLLNYAPHKADSVRLQYDRHVDFQLCDSELECHRDHLRLGDDYVRVLTLKSPPGQTFSQILKGLYTIPCNVVVSSQWKLAASRDIRKLIQSKRRHFHNAKSSLSSQLTTSPSATPNVLIDDSAVATVADLGACLEELDFKGHAFGEFSMTLVLYGQDPVSVNRAVAECSKIFGAHDAQLTEERFNALNAWMNVLPGNSANNLRKLWLLDTNYADLSFLFTPDQGSLTNPHLGTEYLTVFETENGEPYFFNLHSLDIAHTAIFGATGSGKSFLINFLLTHLQKYKPLTYIFDLGGSYENITRLFGGAYLPVGVANQPFTINPFVLPPTPENFQVLHAFLKVLIESGTFRMQADDDRDLFEQIQNLYELEPEQRRLGTLANTLKRSLRNQLQKWTRDADGSGLGSGPYATIFDNAEDNLTFASFQTFDFEGMEKHREVLEPLLFYILHRASAAISDPANLSVYKTVVIDEAWRFFRHPALRQFIQEALKTYRKKNAGVILATQSSEDLQDSAMMPVVVESCPTKLFLANPNFNRTAFRDMFHLNDAEIEAIAKLQLKGQVLIQRPGFSTVVNLRVSPKDYWLFTSDSKDRERRNKAFAEHGFHQGLEILASRSELS